jgi:hypothetical protein
MATRRVDAKGGKTGSQFSRCTFPPGDFLNAPKGNRLTIGALLQNRGGFRGPACRRLSISRPRRSFSRAGRCGSVCDVSRVEPQTEVLPNFGDETYTEPELLRPFTLIPCPNSEVTAIAAGYVAVAGRLGDSGPGAYSAQPGIPNRRPLSQRTTSPS